MLEPFYCFTFKSKVGVLVFSFLFCSNDLVPLISLTFVFQLMFNKELRIVNYLLSLTGIEGPNWLMDSVSVMGCNGPLYLYLFCRANDVDF